MSSRWALVIILTVVTLIIISGWEIYKTLVTEKDVEDYRQYVAPISENIDTQLITDIFNRKSKVLVEEDVIEPQ